MFSTSPYGYGITIYWFVLITFILIWCALFLRLWVRIGMIKQFGWDDALAILAVASCSWLYICIFVLLRDGLGRHEDTVPLPRLVNLFKTYFIAELGYVAGACFFRLSICAFYLRLTPIRWHVWTIRSIMAITIVVSIMYDLVVLFQCFPIPFFWNRITGATDGTCLNPNVIVAFGYTHNTVSIITDWALTALPIFMLYKANMNTRTKISVLLVLSLGLVTSVAAIVRFTALAGLKAVGDFTHNSTGIAFWSGAELSIGILAACAATYRPLFKSFKITRSGSSGAHEGTAEAQNASRFAQWTSRSRQHPEYILSGAGHDLASLPGSQQYDISSKDTSAGSEIERCSVGSADDEAGIIKQVDYSVVTSRQ
ncbi:hypothetical protein K490DRAFT_61368 [Saccharata proteae CBS 121410]|uniref:Rhodopsin domain-containing protein n=1 Tax=Saccharata proteae CBS 121410 TaxID=1314787 RepID=A0A9P4I4F0_9PEZI|nr:hypothetical protein K490DRAFT_61368 [Saccharata proteae CBS 121410]